MFQIQCYELNSQNKNSIISKHHTEYQISDINQISDKFPTSVDPTRPDPVKNLIGNFEIQIKIQQRNYRSVFDRNSPKSTVTSFFDHDPRGHFDYRSRRTELPILPILMFFFVSNIKIMYKGGEIRGIDLYRESLEI